ncbi:hypothetical protein GA0115253_1080214 [Streptomyces sp. Termitarium-T10T-6]|nr:hypothetical protein GA0115253_1080214 [Streptomyces sp. Termitarium-T10T-6]
MTWSSTTSDPTHHLPPSAERHDAERPSHRSPPFPRRPPPRRRLGMRGRGGVHRPEQGLRPGRQQGRAGSPLARRRGAARRAVDVRHVVLLPDLRRRPHAVRLHRAFRATEVRRVGVRQERQARGLRPAPGLGRQRQRRGLPYPVRGDWPRARRPGGTTSSTWSCRTPKATTATPSSGSSGRTCRPGSPPWAAERGGGGTSSPLPRFPQFGSTGSSSGRCPSDAVAAATRSAGTSP